MVDQHFQFFEHKKLERQALSLHCLIWNNKIYNAGSEFWTLKVEKCRPFLHILSFLKKQKLKMQWWRTDSIFNFIWILIDLNVPWSTELFISWGFSMHRPGVNPPSVLCTPCTLPGNVTASEDGGTCMQYLWLIKQSFILIALLLSNFYACIVKWRNCKISKW